MLVIRARDTMAFQKLEAEVLYFGVFRAANQIDNQLKVIPLVADWKENHLTCLIFASFFKGELYCG